MRYAILRTNGQLYDETFETLHRAKCFCKYNWKGEVYKRVKAIVCIKNDKQYIVSKPLYKQKYSWYNFGNDLEI